MTLMNSQDIWFKNLFVIFMYPIDFFPTSSMNITEKLNSIIRLTLYISVLLSFYHKSYKPMYLLLFVMLITVLIYNNQTVDDTKGNTKESFNVIADNQPYQSCTMPTLDNPFMNFNNYVDATDNPDKAPACDLNDPNVKHIADYYFQNDMIQDVDDVYGKASNERIWYTLPNTTLVNSREQFSDWCYNSGATCHEDTSRCLKYVDLRAGRYEFPFTETKPNVSSVPSN